MAETTKAPAHKNLAAALLAIQQEMPAITPDSTNPHFKSKFVSLGKLLAKAKPIANKHGVVISQFPSKDADGQPTLVTALTHTSGERLEYAAPLFLAKSDPQGQGSAITYMRRYALASAFGISDQEDDDGNAGSERGQAERKDAVVLYERPKDAITVTRAAELGKGIGLRGLSYAQINGFLKAAGVGPIKAATGAGLKNRLETLTPADADKFEFEMAKADELPVDASA